LEMVLALAHHGPAMEAARADTEAAEAREDSARALTAPQIGAKLGVTATPGQIVYLPSDGVYVSGTPAISTVSVQGRATLGVSGDYILYDFGQTRAKLRMAGFAREAADRSSEATLEALDTAVGNAYYAWMGSVVQSDAAHDEAEAARL